MNNEMKVRLSNILIAVLWVLVVAVWAPTLLTEFTEAKIYYLRDFGILTKWFDIDRGGLMIWAAITGAIFAAQYLIAGTVRFKLQKQ